MNTLKQLTVVDLFVKQVAKTSNLTAVSTSHFALTYQELNVRANQLAHCLQDKRVKPHDFVALLLEPGIDFVVCMLAIIKIGAVYVPLDSLSPPHRLNEILEDAAPALIISNEKFYNQISIQKFSIFLIDNLKKENTDFLKNNPTHKTKPEDPIYMMYTSGSTGKPKGVIVPHRAVVNLIQSNYIDISQSEIIAQNSNLAFDASVFEIWSAFLNGANLFIVSAELRQDHNQLRDLFLTFKIEYLFLATGYFHQMVRVAAHILDGIKILMVGGEKLHAKFIQEFFYYRNQIERPITLINAYGPTESTVFSCKHILRSNQFGAFTVDELEAIGKPIDNVKLYILDEVNKFVEPGQVGELHISGINLALGYHNDSRLNKKKFITNPFDREKPFDRLYKTGDLVKQLLNGDLLYVGRIDNQVKVRGFRVDLNEIELRLLDHPLIKSAAIIAEKDSMEIVRLVAYVVFLSSNAMSAEAIRSYLANYLPAYMLPSKYKQVEEFPLTSAGKIDRKKLSEEKGIDLSSAPILSIRNATEEKIKAIWSELLEQPEFDVTQNLFELGANSLLIMEAARRISLELELDCPLSLLLTYPSVRKLTQYFEKHSLIEVV